MSLTKLLAGALIALSPLAAQPPRRGGPRTFQQPQPPREVTIAAIPGVVAAGAQWKIAWQGDATSDGIAGTSDGGVLFAQEQTNHIGKVDKNDKFSVFLTTAHGPGAVDFDSKGRIFTVERSCTDPGGHLGVQPDQCTEPTDVALLTPERKIIADSFEGKGLGRVNDLTLNRRGDIYVTSNVVYHVTPDGKVSVVTDKLRPNGIVLSPDEKTLYITNGATIAAFDIQPDGSATNQRDFGKLEGGGAGDGMAVDTKGNVYVTSGPGIQVLDKTGKYLGLIPTPRAAITVTFSGPGKKTLYAGCMGAKVGPNGTEFLTAPGVRNVAMTLYKIPMLSQGLKNRAR